MTRREILKLTDNKLDAAVKIQGTNYDRKRKVTKDIQHRMRQMLSAGKSVDTIAEHFDVTIHTVRYNTDPAYNTWYKKNRSSRKHYGEASSQKERAAYKRSLLKARKAVVLA